MKSFDPRLHNAGKVLDAGIGYLADKAEDDCNDDYIRNLCRIAVEGSDYIVGVVGLDLIAASERYRSIPVNVCADHVSRMDSAAGGLLALLDRSGPSLRGWRAKCFDCHVPRRARTSFVRGTMAEIATTNMKTTKTAISLS